MKKQGIIKYLSVSIVCFSAVLTVMFAGCNNRADSTDILIENEKSDAEKQLENNEKTEEEYEVNVLLSGGSGKTTLKSPTLVKYNNGERVIVLEYSSKNYDYMIVDGEKFLPVNESGNSVFEIPIKEPEGEIQVIADTVAMSKPHEIEYTITYSKNDSGDGYVDSLMDEKDATNVPVNENIKNWLSNHTVTGKLERKYAEKYGVSYYDDKYCILAINESEYYLISDNGDIPEDLPKEINVINIPIKDAYVVSTASMDYFTSLNALDNVKFTSFNDSDDKNEELNEYMNSGKISYAGKYSAPDYEKLLAGGCSLVIENTMISHSEGVLDKLHELKMNTIIDYSSKESTPFGRMEWIKLYGLLTGHQEEAERIFSEKEEKLSKMTNNNTGKRVAYFYITDSGQVVVRKNQDYVVKLIEIAGGEYALNGNDLYNGTGTMTIQKESFFDEIKDCDYLIYNSTISGKINSIGELLEKFSVLSKSKAYVDGNIYCTTENIYLNVMELPEIAEDINRALTGPEPTEYLYRIK